MRGRVVGLKNGRAHGANLVVWVAVQTLVQGSSKRLTEDKLFSNHSFRQTAMTRSNPKKNHLLASLPAAEWKRWLPQLELVELTLGEVLYEPGTTMTHVYFPTTSIVSMLYVMQNGESAEIAVVGFEGLIGIPLFMGGESTSSRAVVQDAGQAYRLPAAAIKKEFEEAPVLHLLLRFTQALISQMIQTAACNKHHTLEQQLCRWLLLSLDRLPTNELVMTEQLIANMLGVKKAVVLVAQKKLQSDGLIHFKAGHITVLSRAGVEAAACECYLAVRRDYERLLPHDVAV